MAILLWLLPPVAVTVVAMLWVGWVGRDRPALSDRSEAAQERAQQRFAEAILREHPAAAVRRTTPRDRSTGVAVRTRKSA
ncbi:hypothetical protein [Nocardioides terrisoli]|uniref:hypothetical protein n=1 Tax=Nocardioides terrisoli TaxID=3388267 RepID=UPI00287B7AAC|nr:hypothetical protein [Nocardioides marmorisolisilvae]